MSNVEMKGGGKREKENHKPSKTLPCEAKLDPFAMYIRSKRETVRVWTEKQQKEDLREELMN